MLYMNREILLGRALNKKYFSISSEYKNVGDIMTVITAVVKHVLDDSVAAFL